MHRLVDQQQCSAHLLPALVLIFSASIQACTCKLQPSLSETGPFFDRFFSVLRTWNDPQHIAVGAKYMRKGYAQTNPWQCKHHRKQEGLPSNLIDDKIMRFQPYG